MKLAPRGGIMTSLVEVRGRILLEAGEPAAGVTTALGVSPEVAIEGIPVRARADAPAALFNNSRREILVSMWILAFYFGELNYAAQNSRNTIRWAAPVTT